jgi:hypothetical protein
MSGYHDMQPKFQTPPRKSSYFPSNDPAIVSPPSPVAPPSTDTHDESFQSAQEGSVEYSALDQKEEKLENFVTPLQKLASKRVRFADDHGLQLLHILELEREAAASGRLVILLLSPDQPDFEFVQVQYPVDESTTTQVLVEQLSRMASNSLFQYTKFVGLSRIKSTAGKDDESHSREDDEDSKSMSSISSVSSTSSIPTILDPSILLGNVGFRDCELVLAVPNGYTPSQMITIAFPLLLNGTIMKALQTGRRSLRGLKLAKNGSEWYRDVRQKNSFGTTDIHRPLQDVYEHCDTSKEWAVVDDLAENVTFFETNLEEYVATWEEMQDMADNHELDERYWGFEGKCDDIVRGKQDCDDEHDVCFSRGMDCENYDNTELPRSAISVSYAGSDDRLVPFLYPRTKEESMKMKQMVQPQFDPDPLIWEYAGGKAGAERIILSIYTIVIAATAYILTLE